MPSILSSKKGVEAAPFFLIVSAVIMIFTLATVYPAISNWMTKMNDAAAMRETQKLRDAINEISSMGDVGSVEKIFVNLPPGYFIEVSGMELKMYRKAIFEAGMSQEDLLTLKMDNEAKTSINPESDDPNELFGQMTIELRYGEPSEENKRPFQIWIG
jgi:hypothetical protein